MALSPQMKQNLDDLRTRILQVEHLTATGEPIPEGLNPSDTELKDALLAARGDYNATPRKTPTRSESKMASESFDLGTLFEKP